MGTQASVAQVLRQHGAAYLATHTLSTPQAKAWRAMVACRTEALGGQLLACHDCAHSHWQYHSCRNRHCPQCGARAKDAWLQGRLAEVLNVPYTHLVFTLPHSLNALYQFHPRWVIDTLFACAAQTLTEFAANTRWMGADNGMGVGNGNGTPAFSLVLHTWTQDLRLHLHVHAVMACGVLGQAGSGHAQWHIPKRSPAFLFPVHALSKVFRGKFVAALSSARDNQAIPNDPQASPAAWAQRQRELYRHPWVVYAKTQGGKRTERLPAGEFIRRYLLHILPTGIKRIRHYGVLASACKGRKLQAAKQALNMAPTTAAAQESAQAFMARVAKIETLQCPCCKVGTLVVIATLAGAKTLPAPGASPQPRCARGPP